MSDIIEKKVTIRMKPKNIGIILSFLNEEITKMKIPSVLIVEGQPPLLTKKGELESLVRELEQEILKGIYE